MAHALAIALCRGTLAALVCVVALTPSAEAQERPNPYVSDVIGQLAYGLYCADPPVELQEAPDTAAGVINIVPVLPEIVSRQTLVPATLGIGFGVLVEAAQGQRFDPALVTITHPPYPDSGIEVERWRTSIDDEGPGLIGFSFEIANELVPGPWVFSAEYEGELLFEVRFEVVPPALLPEVAGLCEGVFLS